MLKNKLIRYNLKGGMVLQLLPPFKNVAKHGVRKMN